MASPSTGGSNQSNHLAAIIGINDLVAVTTEGKDFGLQAQHRVLASQQLAQYGQGPLF